MATKYNQHTDKESQMVAEAVATYGATTRMRTFQQSDAQSVTSEVKDLPLDIIRMAVECALDDEKNGRLIPHEQMRERVAREMGWK